MAGSPEQRTNAFMEWLVSNGGVINSPIKLTDSETGSGRGVYAVGDIAEDEVLFTIPRSAVLCAENSDLKSKMISKDIPDIKVQSVFESSWMELIVVMIYEFLQGANSRWKPYFDILPNEFNSLMFWSKGELEELRGSTVLEKIGRESTDLGFCESLVPVLKDFPELFRCLPYMRGSTATLEPTLSDDEIITLAHRMGSTIMAYAFDLEKVSDEDPEGDDEGFVSDDEDEVMPKGMVPLADMLNADADRNNARLFQTESGLEMRSTKSIQKGEELFNDYGPLPRSDLLRRYGYITDNYAQFDVVEVAFHNIVDAAGGHLELGELEARVSSLHLTIGGPNHTLTSEKIQFLDGEGLYDSAYDLSHPSPSSSAFPDELLILVNLLLLPQIPRKLPKPGRAPQTIAVLRRILEARLKEYPTKLEDDEMLLRDGGLSLRRKMAIEVRLGEKRVLKEAWLEIEGDNARSEGNEHLMDVDLQGWGVKREAEDCDTGKGDMESWGEKRRKKSSDESQ
ncbi:hypothetical protein FGG08_005455 [Glutinoglossum americanum]|uniref:SET domain-containing protein n=1 Tax=Glutinoglossum americanum TaxID=1670608 RepID=A0A9P8L2W2_9PEZI|nr:hypothetical protein FGG08_005455 [Glutinoglossum americanum]